MNKSALLISSFGLLLALAAALFWLGGGAAALPMPEPVGESLADDDMASDVAAGEAALADAEFVAARVDQFGDENERSEVAIEEDDAPRLVIQVWDRKQGVVAPEANVFVLSGYDGPALRDAFAPHWCELAETQGKRYKASSEGRVELPRLERDAIIAATLPGASGMRFLRRDHGELEAVLLLPQETVTVRVLDASGRPVVGAPVGVQQRIPERTEADQVIRDWKDLAERIEQVKSTAGSNLAEASRDQRRLADLNRRFAALSDQMEQIKAAASGDKQAGVGKVAVVKDGKAKPAKMPDLISTHMEMRARRRTDNAGYAVFRHFQLYRHRVEKWWPEEHRDQFEAVLMVPVAEPVSMGFHGMPVPAAVIELRMPPTGSVALRTVDRDGRAFTHPVHGVLRLRERSSPNWTQLSIRKQQNELEIVFPFVGLGMLFDANCRLDDNDFSWRAPEFAGPQQPGERVTVDLVVAPDAAMLYGRLLDATGEPLRDAAATFLINSMRGRLEGEDVLLDHDGRFHLPYEVRGDHQPPWRLQVRYEDRLPVPGFAANLGILPKQGVLDVGDLQIGDLTEITFGRIVNDLGEPIAGARVQLQREREVARRPAPQWQDEAFTDTSSDEAGNFRLFGDLEAGRYRLRVTAREHFPFEEPNLPSRDGAVVTLTRRTRLLGSVLAADWLPVRDVHVRLESHNNPGDNREDQLRSYRGKKLIYFDWVRPGIYSLSLRLQGLPDPFLTIANVEVQAGQRDEHPRLVGLDLTRDIHRFEVIAVNEMQKRVKLKSPLLARVMRQSGETVTVAFPWEGSRVVILNAQPSLEVMPAESGYRADRTTLMPGRSELLFRTVPPLVVRLPGMRQLVGQESVWISLELVGGVSLLGFDDNSRRMAQVMARATSSYGALGEDDRTDLRTLQDGRYRVSARLGDKRNGGLVTVALGELAVRSDANGQATELTVPVDAARVAAAMQELANRRAAGASSGRRRGK